MSYEVLKEAGLIEARVLGEVSMSGIIALRVVQPENWGTVHQGFRPYDITIMEPTTAAMNKARAIRAARHLLAKQISHCSPRN